MTDAPERIWADIVNNDGGIWWREGVMPDGTEYVRADLLAAAYRQGVEDAAKFHDEMAIQHGPSTAAAVHKNSAAAIRTLEYKPEGE